MLKVKNSSPIIVIVCFHTIDWIKNCVESLRSYLPKTPILFIDNNPSIEDSPARIKSYQRLDSYKNSSDWNSFCENERKYVKQVPNSFVVRTDSNCYHHEALDLAMQWCYLKSYDVFVHMEPDCTITSREWFDNLTGSIKHGNAMSGGFVWDSNEVHPCPSAWDVNYFILNQLSFTPVPKPLELDNKLVDNSKSPHFRIKTFDCGIGAWFACAIHNKTEIVPIPGFTHHWMGTDKRSYKNLG